MCRDFMFRTKVIKNNYINAYNHEKYILFIFFVYPDPHFKCLSR